VSFQTWFQSITECIYLSSYVLSFFKKPLDCFGIAPNFDDPSLFYHVEMGIIGDENGICIKAGRGMNNIRQLALRKECCASIYFLLRWIHLDHCLLQIIQKLVCAQRLGIFLIFKIRSSLAKSSAGLSRRSIDEFRALGPSALDCCNEDGVIYEITLNL